MIFIRQSFDLNPCHIITTNYDNLLEQEIENEFKQFAIIREDEDMPNMSYPNSLIKRCTDDYDTNNIVLTESDYYNYANNFPLIRSFVTSLFLPVKYYCLLASLCRLKPQDDIE